MPPICTGGLLPAYVILRGRIAVQEKIASPSNLGEPHQTMASSLTNLLYHIVFSTKERIPLIHEDLEEPLYDYIGGILRGQRSILLEIGGMPDHAPLPVKLRQTLRSRKRSASSNRTPPAGSMRIRRSEGVSSGRPAISPSRGARPAWAEDAAL